MPEPSDRRARKRLATRKAISDTATRLFMERGFDHVTVDEIAEAADVGRMTVFNHFPRKEDMFFD
ncbi:MAG: TetR family transcriptional regulator, partial [Mesorhizobium sp.]